MKFLKLGWGFLSSLWSDRTGQGMVEYGLILALIAVAVIVVLTSLGGDLTNLFNYIINSISSHTPASP